MPNFLQGDCGPHLPISRFATPRSFEEIFCSLGEEELKEILLNAQRRWGKVLSVRFFLGWKEKLHSGNLT